VRYDPSAYKGLLQEHLPQRRDLHRLGPGLDLTGTMLYFGSPTADIAADFTPEQRRDVTIRKQILWDSMDATDAEARGMELQLIRELRSNDPSIDYNRWPKLR